MSSLQVRPIKIRRWFPPQDRIATAVATLCILREDFFLELRGIITDDIEALDKNSTAYRRTYFWRNSLRTLMEIRQTLNALSRVPAFRAAMAEEMGGARHAFEAAKDALNRASEKFLRDLRNTLGGHIDLERMQEGLDQIDIQIEAFGQFGDSRQNTQFTFALELLWAAILRDSPTTAALEDVNRILGDTSALIAAFGALDEVIGWYIHSRRLS
jgi:hypothetical protein